MVKVKPFGVVVEVVVDDNTYYCVLVNDFDRFKTFGNYDLVSDPFLVLDSDMLPLSDENEELFEQLNEIIEKYVINQDEQDE